MPQNETPPEVSVPKDNDTQASAEADISSREAAALEEKLAAEVIAAGRNTSAAVTAEIEARPSETLIGNAARGRDVLLAKLREHSSKPKEVYVPPPMTDNMRIKLEAEMEAGRRAGAKAQAQQNARPPRPHDPREGYPGTPVHRPGDVVPDPTLLNTTGFAAGTKRFSPDV